MFSALTILLFHNEISSSGKKLLESFTCLIQVTIWSHEVLSAAIQLFLVLITIRIHLNLISMILILWVFTWALNSNIQVPSLSSHLNDWLSLFVIWSNFKAVLQLSWRLIKDDRTQSKNLIRPELIECFVAYLVSLVKRFMHHQWDHPIKDSKWRSCPQ